MSSLPEEAHPEWSWRKEAFTEASDAEDASSPAPGAWRAYEFHESHLNEDPDDSDMERSSQETDDHEAVRSRRLYKSRASHVDDSEPAGSRGVHRSHASHGKVHADHEPFGEADDPEVDTEPTEPENASTPRPRRHYPPRQCRICLEVVLPTFETPTEGVSAMFNPAPSVEYISSEPESGRLLRPCKCKGSQKYVHEGCLQAWRHVDPAYGRRNYFECPTCGFKYRLERLRWSRLISSTFMQVLFTLGIFVTTVFVFGFIADPIINLYLDPYDTITGDVPLYLDDEDDSWAAHFLKGVASLGLVGVIQSFFAMGPWNWWNMRNTTGMLGRVVGGGGGRRRGTGRDRMEDISWSLVLIGVFTFLYVSQGPHLSKYQSLPI